MAQHAPYSTALAPKTALSVVSARPSAPRAPLARVRVEARYLQADQTHRSQASLPVMGSLLTAFASFTHGTEFAVADGPNIAVEDLEPGMTLRGLSGKTARLTWIGSVELTPAMLSRISGPDSPALVRILPDRFGYARPARDIVTSGETRICVGPGRKPAGHFVDYESVLPVSPPGAVRMYQLVCETPLDLVANGMGAPSFSLNNWLSLQTPPLRALLGDLLPGQTPSHQVA